MSEPKLATIIEPHETNEPQPTPQKSPKSKKERRTSQNREPGTANSGETDNDQKSQSNGKDNNDAKSPKKVPKDLEILSSGKEIAQKFLLPIIDAWRVKSSGKIFVLTPSHFLLVKPTDNRHPSLFKWSSLSSISFPKKNLIALQFKEEPIQAQCEGITVRTDKHEFNMVFDQSIFKTVASYLLDTIQRVLTDTELKELNISSLGAPPVSRSTRSAMSRFHMGSQGNPSILLDETIQIMNRVVQQGIPYLDLGQINDLPVFLPIFFDCLPFITTMKSIRIPPNNIENLPEQIENLLKEKSSLKSIDIDGKLVKTDLLKIIDPIKRNQDSNIRGLEFSLSDFHSEELDTIADLVSHSNIKAIGFHEAISNSGNMDTYFYTTFLSPLVTQNLYCLNLDNSYNLDIDRLFPKLSKVRFLSLANCDLEITNVISKLPLIVMSRLTELNLSGNRVSNEEFIDETIQFPHYLRSLILNDISWPTDSLQLFLYQIFKKIPEKLKLSLANTTMDQNEWYKFFDFLKNTELGGSYKSLSVLVWDGNPLHVNLFKFLARNTYLTRLQMNNCFHDEHDENELFNHLAAFFKSAQNLRTLIIHGSDGSFVGKNTPELIRGIDLIPNLEILDISDSRGGDISMQPIELLLKKHPKLRINFDGLRPNDLKNYSQFCRNLIQIQVPPTNADPKQKDEEPSVVEMNPLLRITYPIRDLQYMKDQHLATSKEVSSLFIHKFYYYLHEQLTEREELKATLLANDYKFDVVCTELDKPGNFSYLSADNDFPRYISDDLIHQFKKDNQPLSIKGKPEEDNFADDEVFRSMIYKSRRYSQRTPISTYQQPYQPANPISDSTSSTSEDKQKEQPIVMKFKKPQPQQKYSPLPHIVNSPLKSPEPKKKTTEVPKKEEVDSDLLSSSTDEDTISQQEKKDDSQNDQHSSYSSDDDEALKTPRDIPKQQFAHEDEDQTKDFPASPTQNQPQEAVDLESDDKEDEKPQNDRNEKEMNDKKPQNDQNEKEINDKKPKIEQNVTPKVEQKTRDVQLAQEHKDDVSYDDSTFAFPLSVDLMKYEYKDWKALDKSFTLQNMFTDITKENRSQRLSVSKEDQS